MLLGVGRLARNLAGFRAGRLSELLNRSHLRASAVFLTKNGPCGDGPQNSNNLRVNALRGPRWRTDYIDA